MDIKVNILGRYGEFGNARTIVDENGITWYCANDILDILMYSEKNRSVILSRYCRNVRQFDVTCRNDRSADVTLHFVRSHITRARKSQTMNFITRDDIFRLLDHSKMPKAEEFRKWLFSDVIPSIEYSGGYIDPEVIEEVKIDPINFIKKYEETKTELISYKEIVEKQKSEIRKNEIKINILEDHYDLDEQECINELVDEIDTYDILIKDNQKYQSNYRKLEERIENLNRFLPFLYPEKLKENSIPLIRFF